MGMVKPTKLTSLLLLLFFITGRLYTALQQGGNVAAKGCNAISREDQALLDDVLAATTGRETWLRGRKMALGDVKRLDKVKRNGATGGTAKISSATLGGGGYLSLDVEGQQSHRSLLSKEMDVAGFVPFGTADYNEPRYHPPKNN
ncbi:unnamed protein product [Ilex paraguariensis]|uniref:Uncharacterized protein n=1 Tax=Ilex paraguariensis TaxID=185542 RepID=A0ABC8RC08_9AQUA